MTRSQVNDAIKEMPARTHAVLVYDSAENKRDVLYNHLKMGVDTDGLVYVCSEESPRMAREELQGSGMDVESLESKGLLSVKNYDEVYIVDGEVNSPRIIEDFSNLAWKYSREGLKGIRASAEMSCFFKAKKVEELVSYENALHRTFSFPGRGLCGYNLLEMEDTGSLESLWPILRAHQLVIMTGPNGSFALEPEAISKSDVESTMRIEL